MPHLTTLCALVLLVGCATSGEPVEVARKPKKSAPPTEERRAPSPDAGAREQGAAASTDGPGAQVTAISIPAAPEPFGDVGFKEVTEKDWLAGVRSKLAQQLKIEPAELRFSPGRLHAFYVRSTPPPIKPVPRPPPRRHQIIVVDNQGRRLGQFRVVTAPKSDEPPKDLRFLSEDRLIYEVVASPPPTTVAVAQSSTPKPAARARKAARKSRAVVRPAAKPANHESPRTAADKPATPTRLFIIQPVAASGQPRARLIRCEGIHFAFTHQNDKLAFVGGQPEAAFVAVDGAQVYPRKGRTVVSSAPVWSKDGRSVAFLESPAAKPTRLVLLAEFDNPTGDTTWDLPPTAPVDGTRVFWAGSGKLVVGKTALRPIFSASFHKESPNR